jgi:hypothetical protein
MKSILFAMALCAVTAFAEDAKVITENEKLDPATSQTLQEFKAKVQQAHPDMDVVKVDADVVKTAVLAPKPQPLPKTPVLAIFVKNNSRVQGMDDEVDGIRDRLAAELAGLNFVILDQTEIANAFARYKITTAEERAGMVQGLMSGATITRVGQMLGANYILISSIIDASAVGRTVGGATTTVYTLRMTTKVLDAANGASVYGGNWSQKLPVLGEQPAGAMNYYNDLVDRWAMETGQELAQTSPRWREPAPDDGELAEFSVSTSIDSFIAGLDGGVQGTADVKDALRKVVGGVTIELDGVAIGTSPARFKTKPGLHQLRVTRQWMTPWQRPVNIQNGSAFNVALELSPDGLKQYSSMENLKAAMAISYAEAAFKRGARVNFDTAAWRDVTLDTNNGTKTTVVQ